VQSAKLSRAKVFLFSAFLLCLFSGCSNSIEDRKSFFASFELVAQGHKTINPTNQSSNMITVDPSVELKALKLYDQALEEASKVSDKFLRSIHPDLPRRYREQFQKSIFIVAEQMRSGKTNIQNSFEAAQLDAVFKDWYFSNVSKEFGGSR
jgi:hypothetical protein